MATIIRVGGVPSEGNATPADVIAGKTFSNDSDTGLTGTLKYPQGLVVHNLGVFNSNESHDVSVSGYSGYQNFARDNFWVRVTGVVNVDVSDTNSVKNQIVGDYNASTGIIHLNPCYDYENYHGRHYYVEYTLFLLTVE